MKVLTIEICRNVMEVHVLMVGEVFPRFGGSKQGLVVKDTPSIIIRDILLSEKGRRIGVTDTEVSIQNVALWGWIQSLINKKTGQDFNKDILAALKACHACLDSLHKKGPFIGKVNAICEKAQSAIAKAEGESK